ncbi:MAG TPA: EexN family lipoprotein [Gammaproteobacteria bacterium]|nr:EexN family lipoprotein [Gammaproteobacteria bacterium]
MGATIALATLVACQQERGPRTVSSFMDDGLAREGVLARCNQDAEASKSDVECDNARRAAAAIAAADAADDHKHSADLARQSERKMLAMRERDSQAQHAEARAEAEARAQSDADYEAQWREQSSAGRTASANDVSTDYDFVPARPTLQAAAVAPPKGDVTIVAPELKSSDVAIIPRPFRPADADKGAQPPR